MEHAELLAEFDSEMRNTRNMLENVPSDKFGWQPHARSKSLGELANHLAAMPALVAAVVSGQAQRYPDALSTDALLENFDKNWALGQEALQSSSTEHINALIQPLKMTKDRH